MQLQLPPIPPIVVQWIAPERHFYTQWDFWLTVATMALVAVTVWLVIETHRMRTSSDTSMREMLRHAEASADAATLSAETGRLALELSERADVLVDKIELTDPNAIAQSNVALTLKNFGRTRAIDLHGPVFSGIRTNVPPKVPTAETHTVLGAGAELKLRTRASIRDTLGEAAYTEMVSGDEKKRFRMWGSMTYTDVFGKSHPLHFCASLNPRTWVFIIEENRAE